MSKEYLPHGTRDGSGIAMESADALFELVRATLNALPPLAPGSNVARVHARLSELQELRERAVMRLRALQATSSEAAQSIWRLLELAEDEIWSALELGLSADSAPSVDTALESLVPRTLLDASSAGPGTGGCAGSALLRPPLQAHARADIDTAALHYALRRVAYMTVTAAFEQDAATLERIVRRVWLLERRRRALQRHFESRRTESETAAVELAPVRVQRARQSVLVACAVDVFVPFLFEHFEHLDEDVRDKARDRVQRLLARLPWLGVVDSTSLELHLGSISGQLRQYATAAEAPVDAPRDEGMVALVNELFLPLVLHYLGTMPRAASTVHTDALLASLQRVLEQQRSHDLLSAHVDAHLDALLAWLCSLLRDAAHAGAAASLLLALCTRISAPVITLRIVQALAEPHVRSLRVLPWLRAWLEPESAYASASAEEAAQLVALWQWHAVYAYTATTAGTALPLPAAHICAGSDGYLYECPASSRWLRVGVGEQGSVLNHVVCSAVVPAAAAASGAHSVAVLAACSLLVFVHLAPLAPDAPASHTLAFGALDSSTFSPVDVQVLCHDACTTRALHVDSPQWQVRLVADPQSLVALVRAPDGSLEVFELSVHRDGATAQLRVSAPRRVVRASSAETVRAPPFPACTPSADASVPTSWDEVARVGTPALDYPDTVLGTYMSCTARPELAQMSFEELRFLAYSECVSLADTRLGALQWREARFELRGRVLLVLQPLAPAPYVWCRELDLHAGTLLRGYLQHAPTPLPAVLCDRAHFRGPAVPSVARLLSLDAGARILADDTCSVERALLLVLAALCESLRRHARPVEVSRELELLLGLLVSFGADRAPSVALRAQCVLLAQLLALRLCAAGADALSPVMRERVRRVMVHLLRTSDAHELGVLWRRELSLVLALPELSGDVAELVTLTSALLRSEVAMLALLDAGTPPPSAYLGTSLALHLQLCGHADVPALFARLSEPWTALLPTFSQLLRDMALVIANEARGLARHGVASRAFPLPWTRFGALTLQALTARLDLGPDTDASANLVLAFLKPLCLAGASLLPELAAAPSRPADVGALLSQTYLALFDTHCLELAFLEPRVKLALATPLLEPLTTLLVVADKTLAQLESRWLRLTTRSLALVAGQFIAALYEGPALSREEVQYDEAFLRLSFFRAPDDSAHDFSLVEDGFVSDLVKGVPGSAAMTFYYEMLSRLKRSLPRKDNASLNALERTFIAAVLRHTGLVRDALKIVHASINVALEMPVLTRVFTEALKIRLLAIEHSRRDPLGKTPLKHHALASHLLSLPRAWRTLFEEPPSVLPSLLVAGRARRFSSGDALSRVIRTLGRAQETPVGANPHKEKGARAGASALSSSSKAGDARAWSTLRTSVEEHRERLNREHEQRVLTTFKHWQLVKQRSETHTVGAGAVAGDASAAGTSAMALKIERIVDEILLFFRRAESLAQVQAFQETKSLRADLRFAGLRAACSVLVGVRPDTQQLFLFALRDVFSPAAEPHAHALRHYLDDLGVVRAEVTEKLRTAFHSFRAQLVACVESAAVPVVLRVLALSLLPYKLEPMDLAAEAHAAVFERLYTLFHATLPQPALRVLAEQLRVFLALYVRSLALVRVAAVAEVQSDLVKQALQRVLREIVQCADVCAAQGERGAEGVPALEAQYASLHEHVALLTLLVDTAPVALLRFLLRHADFPVLVRLVHVDACALKTAVVRLLRRLVERTHSSLAAALRAALTPLAPALFEQLFDDVAHGLALPYHAVYPASGAFGAEPEEGAFVSRWEHCSREVFASFAAEAARLAACIAATPFGAALLTAHVVPLLTRVTALFAQSAAPSDALVARCLGLLTVLSGDIQHLTGARVSFLRATTPESSRSDHHCWLTGHVLSVSEEHALVLLDGSEEKLTVPLAALMLAEDDAGASPRSAAAAVLGEEAARTLVTPLLQLHDAVTRVVDAVSRDAVSCLRVLADSCVVARVRVLCARVLAALVAGAPVLACEMEALVRALPVPVSSARDTAAPHRVLTEHAIDRAERALVTLALSRPWAKLAQAAALEEVCGPDGWRLVSGGSAGVRLEGLFQARLVVMRASAPPCPGERLCLVANRLCSPSHFYAEFHIVSLRVPDGVRDAHVVLSLVHADASAGAELLAHSVSARLSLSATGECVVGGLSLGVLDAALFAPGVTIGIGAVRGAFFVTKNGVLLTALPAPETVKDAAPLALVLTLAPTLDLTLHANFGSEPFRFDVRAFEPPSAPPPAAPALAPASASSSPAPALFAASSASSELAPSIAERVVVRAGTRYRAKAPKTMVPTTLPELRAEELRQVRWGDMLFVRAEARDTVPGGAPWGRVLALRHDTDAHTAHVLLEFCGAHTHSRRWLPHTALALNPTHGSADAAAHVHASALGDMLWRTSNELQLLRTLHTALESSVAHAYKALFVQYVEVTCVHPAALLGALPVDALLAHVLHEVDALPLSALDSSPPLFERRALLALLSAMRTLLAAEAHAHATPFGTRLLSALVDARLWLTHARRAEVAAWLVQEAFVASAPALREHWGAEVLTCVLAYLDRPPHALRVRDRAHLVAQLLAMLAPLRDTEDNASPASEWSEWVRAEIAEEHERLRAMADPERARVQRLLLELLWRMRVLGWDDVTEYPLLTVKNESQRGTSVRVTWAVYKDTPNPFDRVEYLAACARTLHEERRVPDVLLNEAYVALAHERVLDLDPAHPDGLCDFAHATALAVRPFTRDPALLAELQLGTDGNELTTWDARTETLLHETVLAGSRLRWRYSGASRLRVAVRPVFSHAYKLAYLEQHKMDLYELLSTPAWRGASLVDTLRLLARYLEQLTLDDVRAAEALFFCAATAELDVRRSARVAALAQLRDVAAVPLGFALLREWTLLVAHALPHLQLTTATSVSPTSLSHPVIGAVAASESEPQSQAAGALRLCEHVLLVRDLCWSPLRRDFVRVVLASLPRAETPLAVELSRFDSALFAAHASDMHVVAGRVAAAGASVRSSSVDERSVFAQLFRQLRNADAAALRVPWRTHFVHEDAVDAGGLYRESLELWADDLQSARVGLLMPCPNAQAVVNAQRGDEEPPLVDNGVGDNRDAWIPRPAARDPRALAQFRFVGRVLGAALCADTALALSFPSVVWKRLVGAALDVSDVRAFDSFCGQSLESLAHTAPLTPELQHSLAQLLLEERFTTLLSDGTRVELKPRGAEQSLTWGNRLEYVALVVQARLAESAPQVAALAQGLDEVVPLALLRLLTWRELERAVCGVPHVDWCALQAHVDYDGYTATDAPVKLLWRVLETCSPGELNAFVRFVWGRSRLPDAAHWAPRDRLRVVRVGVAAANDKRGTQMSLPLPSAATCFFQLNWPPYASEEEARAKLLQALAMSQCFV